MVEISKTEEELLEEYRRCIETQKRVYMKYKRLDAWIGNLAVGLITVGTYFGLQHPLLLSLPTAGAGLIFIKKQCGLAEIASKAKTQRQTYLKAYNDLKKKSMPPDLVDHFNRFVEINMNDITTISKGSRIQMQVDTPLDQMV